MADRETGAAADISVLVPVLDEAVSLGDLLASIASQTRSPREVLVADGGSQDGTAELAAASGATVIRCPRAGRGDQIAYALAKAQSAAVLVAHADMQLSENAIATIEKWLSRNPDSPGGCLGHRFAARTFGLRLVELADWARARFQGISYGDQAQFFRPAALRAAGGFPAQPLMEDLELSLRLRKLGKPAYLGVLATVSGRRFLRDGWWRTLGLNRRLRAAYRRGGPALAADLYRRYYPKRQELADKGQA